MCDEPPQISILDARLAEIDDRLRAIQTGLVAGHPDEKAALSAPVSELPPRVVVPEPLGPAPAPAPDTPRGDPAPAPDTPRGDPASAGDPPRGEPGELIVGLRGLAAVHERLLEAVRELMGAYEDALSRFPATAPPTASAPAPAMAPARVRQVSVSAGPFDSTEALRGFERALAAIPEVREVEVRGYTGGDRALVDVQLAAPTS